MHTGKLYVLADSIHDNLSAASYGIQLHLLGVFDELTDYDRMLHTLIGKNIVPSDTKLHVNLSLNHSNVDSKNASETFGYHSGVLSRKRIIKGYFHNSEGYG